MPRPWGRAVVAVLVVTGLVLLLALISLAEAFSDRDRTAVAVIKGAHVDHILRPRQFDALGGDIGPDFGVTAGQVVALSVAGRLRAVDNLGSAPRVRDVNVTGSQPSSFALDVDGTMLAVADGFLGVLDPDGAIGHGVPLAFEGMRVAPSSHAGFTYLFGGKGADYRLYRFLADGTLQVLLQSDEAIVAAADSQDAIYAATPTTIIRLRAGKPDILFKTPDDDFAGPIRSLAVTDDGMVVFATDTKVYALLGSNALSIVNDAGGSVRTRGRALYVLDPQRKLLFRLEPASARLVTTGPG